MLKKSLLYVLHTIHNYEKQTYMFCGVSCDASGFTVSHFRPSLPSVYEITVTHYVFVRRKILIYAMLSVKNFNT